MSCPHFTDDDARECFRQMASHLRARGFDVDSLAPEQRAMAEANVVIVVQALVALGWRIVRPLRMVVQ